MKRGITTSVRFALSLVSCRQLLLVILFAMVFGFSRAQQMPLFTNYYHAKFLANPAFAGIDNEYRAFGFVRSQWVGMPGHPVTAGATLEGSFWKDRIGAGVMVVNDKIGFFDRTQVGFTYNQKITFAKHHQISVGAQLGFFNTRIDWSKSSAKDLTDPNIQAQINRKNIFDLGVGLSYKWKKLLVGFSIPQVTQMGADFAREDSLKSHYRLARHYNAFAQYEFSMAKGKFNITPTLFMRKSRGSKFQFDALLMLDYNHIVFAGAGYRNEFGVITTVGANIINMFTVAYAYDFTLQKTLKGNTGGTHEVVFGFKLPTDFVKRHREEKKLKDQAELIKELKGKNDTLNKKLRQARYKIDSLVYKVKPQGGGVQPDSIKNLQRQVDSLQRLLKADTLRNTFKQVNPPGSNDNSNLKGKVFELDKLLFETNSDKLKPVSEEQLNKLAEFMDNSPTVDIKVNGYSDNVGNDEYNLMLSEKRAKAVVDYLVSKGIPEERLSYQGYGEANPVSDNDTEASRAKNRRVEFEIVRQ